MPQPPSPLRQNSIFRSWISLLGLLVLASSVFAFFLLLTIDFFAGHSNAYLGIATFLIAPMVFVFGLLLMAVGKIWQRRQLARVSPDAPLPRMAIDLTRKRDRRLLAVFVLGSIVFLLLTSVGSYQTYHFSESVQFCGQACHTPMEPEFVTYQHSPHARVACTRCHIGPGALNYAKAKFNGIRQLYEVAANEFPRPIDAHAKINIDQKTCEQCHWPKRFVGNLERTYQHFLDDDQNTPYAVRLLLKVGGGDPTHGPVGGIHWHMNVANQVEYIATDDSKQKIPWVRFTDEHGKAIVFKTADFKPDPQNSAIHKMDCMDCHNRPAHHFRTPNDAVDLAIANGSISTNLPAVKRAVVLAVTKPYKTRDEALAQIESSLRTKFAGRKEGPKAIEEAKNIYSRYFFPEMNTSWKIHPNNIGHKDWPGCFRCHDGKHLADDGKSKLNAENCNACHLILAQGKADEILKLYPQGGEFKHPDEGWKDMQCFDCHNGTIEEEKTTASTP